MDRLKGKVAIVTGGASGIGLAIAAGFAREGARVCVADLEQKRCEEAARKIGQGAFGHKVDVRNLASIDALVRSVVESEGGIDILVNSAGVFGMQLLTEITEEEFDRIYGVNTRGLLFVTQGVVRAMLAQKRGDAIINIISGSGRRGTPAAAVYSSSKGAVISMTQALALELIPHGIRVNGIAPGPVRTPMWDEVERVGAEAARRGTAFALGGKEIDPDAGGAEAAAASVAPIGRIGRPEEFAGIAILLASSAESSNILGQVYNVDGGSFLN